MEKVTLSFSAKGQSLRGCLFRFASNTVNYIEAKFDLGENWGGFDSVRAVWFTDFNCISTVLDTDGVCVVPHEVLNKAKREVKVNLVGSIVEDGELTDRLTTYPIKAIIIDADAKICGSETAEVTPSQFEQYVEAVKAEVAKIKDIDSVELNDDYTLTIYFSDGTETTIGPIRGEQGPAGPAGPQGETGNGIASIDKTSTAGSVDTYTITFTDGTTTTFEVRNGEVSFDTLESLMPVDTASGDIASFPDGQGVFPAKSLKVSLDPIQDLHGYDAPWVGGAGKNLMQCTATSKTESGVTWTVNSDGSITVSGTATGYTALTYGLAYVYGISGNVTLSGIRGANNVAWAPIYLKDENKTNIGSISYDEAMSESITWNMSDYPNAYYVEVAVKRNNNIATNGTFGIQLEKGSTFTAWQPYENICPISGHTEVEVVRTGKNLFDKTATDTDNGYVSGKYVRSTDGATVNLATASVSEYISVKGGTQYVVSPVSGTNPSVCFYDANKTFISGEKYDGATTKTFTTPSNAEYLRFSITNANLDITQLELGTTATTYEPYNGQTYTTALGQTVYGGTLDVVSGVLTVDSALVDLSQLSWSARPAWGGYRSTSIATDVKRPPNTSTKLNGCYCETYKQTTAAAIGLNTLYQYTIDTDGAILLRMEDGKTSSDITGNLVYPLAAPTTTQLTPQQIQTLLGVNNIWADSGDVEVVYIADIKLYVDNH